MFFLSSPIVDNVKRLYFDANGEEKTHFFVIEIKVTPFSFLTLDTFDKELGMNPLTSLKTYLVLVASYFLLISIQLL